MTASASPGLAATRRSSGSTEVLASPGSKPSSRRAAAAPGRTPPAVTASGSPASTPPRSPAAAAATAVTAKRSRRRMWAPVLVGTGGGTPLRAPSRVAVLRPTQRAVVDVLVALVRLRHVGERGVERAV